MTGLRLSASRQLPILEGPEISMRGVMYEPMRIIMSSGGTCLEREQIIVRSFLSWSGRGDSVSFRTLWRSG